MKISASLVGGEGCSVQGGALLPHPCQGRTWGPHTVGEMEEHKRTKAALGPPAFYTLMSEAFMIQSHPQRPHLLTLP